MGIRRIATGAALLVMASTGAMTVGATQATADRFDCTSYLHFQGYGGKIVDIGCNFGAQGDEVICVGSLQIAGVPDDIAQEACRRAALP